MFLHRAGWYRPGGSPFSSPVRWSCRCTRGFLFPVLPGCHWIHEHLFAVSRTKFQLNIVGELDLALDMHWTLPQTAPCWDDSHRAWDFRTVRSGIDPGDYRFRSQFVRVVDVSKDFWPRDGTLSSRSGAWPRPLRNQTVRLGFPYRSGRHRPGGSPFSSPVRPSRRCVEGFLIRG